jgi:hypothetical protein
MRKKVLGGVCVALLVFYLGLLVTPVREHTSAIVAARAASEARLQENAAVAGNPEQNGYYTAELLEYWGRKDTEYKDDSKFKKATNHWQQYSAAANGAYVDHQHYLESPEEVDETSPGVVPYLEARQEYAEYVPAVLEAWSKPHFTVGDKVRTYDTLVPNYLSLRATAQCLAGYAEAMAATGDDAEAARVLLPIFHLGQNMEGRGGSVISTMIGVALQSVAFDGAMATMGPEADLTAEQWKEAALKIQASAPPADVAIKDIEDELATADRFFADPKPADGSVMETGSGIVLLAYIPGFWSREGRIYDNNMGDLLESLQQGKQPDLRSSRESHSEGT